MFGTSLYCQVQLITIHNRVAEWKWESIPHEAIREPSDMNGWDSHGSDGEELCSEISSIMVGDRVCTRQVSPAC